MKIGICGYGFVGNAIGTFFTEKNYNVTIYDKYKEINSLEVILDTDIVFICLPTNYDKSIESYNMTEINLTIEMLDKYGYSGIIVIKSTVLPNYCHNMNNMYPNLSIVEGPFY